MLQQETRVNYSKSKEAHAFGYQEHNIISAKAVGLISGMPTIDILNKERYKKYNGETTRRRQPSIHENVTAKEDKRYILAVDIPTDPNIAPWINRKFRHY